MYSEHHTSYKTDSLLDQAKIVVMVTSRESVIITAIHIGQQAFGLDYMPYTEHIWYQADSVYFALSEL